MPFSTSWWMSVGVVLGMGCLTFADRAWAGSNLEATIDRPLRYKPDGTDFVIVNGREFFNRPLYGGNTAFRVDAGDKPEFSFYLPGHAGNVRLGYRTDRGVLWLNDAKQVVSRYRPGSYVYEITDPIIGTGPLKITAVALRDTEGLALKIEPSGVDSAAGEFIWVFGGMNGQRGNRGGDIGAERQPVGQMFQLKPEFARGNAFDIDGDRFTLTGALAAFAGTSLPASTLAVADAGAWASATDLLASAGKPTDLPILAGRLKIGADAAPAYVVLQRVAKAAATTATAPREINSPDTSRPDAPGPASRPAATRPVVPLALPYAAASLPGVFDAAESQRATVAGRLAIETPDPYLNAAVVALNMAADSVWDEREGAFMHGAVAWRTKLLGWRGPYSGDTFGNHDRTRRHLGNWLGRQNVKPIPDEVGPADESANFARAERALHSNGDLSNSHYDMNLVAIDVLFRHLLWTGDLEYAKQVWPVIERHLAWERRLFRRPFGEGAAMLPLYEAYACIWASDDLAYNGGGATHSSAYNYYHNKMAARVAELIGKDPAPYKTEADLILKGMRRELWMPDKGSFAEWKDILGLKLVHPSIALWTFYHTVDSEVTTPLEAWQMSRYVESTIRKIPVKGPGVPDEGLYTMPTSNWFPYQWSTNNVVMGEASHTALALWQSGRADEANKLFKGLIVDSMYLGLCPGNAGMATFFDVARSESQRDFSDACGTVSRTLIEGLFGIKPDALAGEVVIRPGFPAHWENAKLRHPDVSLDFQRDGMTDVYDVQTKFAKPLKVRMQLAAPRDGVESVSVNGKPVEWTLIDGVGEPRIEVIAAHADRNEIQVRWRGKTLVRPDAAALAAAASTTRAVSIKQGDMSWWEPTPLDTAAPKAAMLADWKTHRVDAGKLEPVDLKAAFNDNVTQIFRNKYLAPRSPYVSLAIPWQGIGSWCHPTDTFDIDDAGLRELADKSGGNIVMPQGVSFATPGKSGGKNVLLTSRWENYPPEASVPVTGKSSHAYLLMAGSTHSMQSQFDNGEVIVTYADGSTDRLALRNPTTWWPIEQDYAIDDYQFHYPGSIPPRVDLKTGTVRILTREDCRGKGKKIPGGSATVLDLPLDGSKELKSLTVRALSNEVVIGLMSLTLAR